MLNRSEKSARYEHNGLGYRVGKKEGSLLDAHCLEEKLDPVRQIQEQEIHVLREIEYTIDLTREYHNLLQREEGKSRQVYFWDGNAAFYEEGGSKNFYLQDELGSPIRSIDVEGNLTDTYGYDEFGNGLYSTRTGIQSFGYTGFQYDGIAETYYAQAREYLPETGRFTGEDLIGGFMEDPVTINRYGYCWENPLRFVDLDGMAPTEEECKGRYYEETMYGDVKGPSLNLYMGGSMNDEKKIEIWELIWLASKAEWGR